MMARKFETESIKEQVSTTYVFSEEESEANSSAGYSNKSHA
jgi:hypothetical protein